MRILFASGSAPVGTIVCSQHGDERFGITVFERLLRDSRRREHLHLVLANEEAIERNTRYIATDLNRSYPGSLTGSLEEQMAYALLPVAQSTRIVLDIHTTTANIQMVPIVANLSDEVKQMLAHTSSTEIALIAPSMASHSLIGNVRAGVSLEFNEHYATTEAAYDDVLRVIDGVIEHRTANSSTRNIFTITGGIPIDTVMPEHARDYEFIPELGVYPFLLHERAYATHYHALAATSVESVVI